MSCLADDDLERIAMGQASAVADAQPHLDECAACRRTVAELIRLGDGDAADAGGDERAGDDAGSMVGRYLVLDVIGAGAEGVVYSAYDPHLDRKVALKLLPSAANERGRESLAREAKAMAKIRHPNVLMVHDVGTRDDDVFIAMELVEGLTFRQWLRSAKPPVSRVLRALSAAGQGLAAAHAAKVIHGDFKPENLLIDETERVRVSDFGMAVEADTERSVRGGTLGYRAPEQRQGQVATAESDQFAFCVTAYEALAGHRPAEIGAVEPPPGPRWLQGAIMRGLETDPTKRFGSMSELVAVLERGQRAPNRSWAFGLVLGATVFAFGTYAWSTRRAPCVDAAEALQRSWSDDQRQAITRAFTASRDDQGQVMSERVLAMLDRYAKRLATMRVAACEAGGPKVDCLNRRQLEFDALVTVLQDADERTRPRAIGAVASLPVVEECVDAQPQPVGSNEAEAALAQARALLNTGQVKEGLVKARQAVTLARAEGAEAQVGRGLLITGDLEDATGDFQAAGASYRAAVSSAAAGKDAATTASSWVSLAFNLSARQNQPSSAALAIQAATSTLDLNSAPEVRIYVERTMGSIADDQGNFDVALQHYERALALDTSLTDAAALRRAMVLHYESLVYNTLGQFTQARRTAQQSVEGFDRTSPGHYALGQALLVLGTAQGELGETDQAVETLHRVISTQGPELAMKTSTAGLAATNLAYLLYRADRPEEAGREAMEAVRLLTASVGTNDPLTIFAAALEAAVWAKVGQVAEARQRIDAALVQAKSNEGLRLQVLGLAGQVFRASHQRARAGNAYVEGIALAKTSNEDLIDLLLWEGELLVDERNFAGASLVLQRAGSISVEGLPQRNAQLKFSQAQVAWALSSRLEARWLAYDAWARAAPTPPKVSVQAQAVDAWLATH